MPDASAAAASAFVCAISGQLAEQPVVSRVSGEIFEKRLIIQYLESEGVDPVTKQPLTEADLIDIKLNDEVRVHARPVQTSSIPSLLKTLQDEWDSLMLNNFTLRQEVQAAREELTHALYQNDAACRVINRLSLELQSARSAMSKLPVHRLQQQESENRRPEVEASTEDTDVDMAEALPGLSEQNTNKIGDKGTELSAQRKQKGRKAPQGLVDFDTLANFKETAQHTGIHSTGTPGITCLDLNGRTTLTGGVDKTLALFNLDSEEIEATFKGHKKPITACIIHPQKDVYISSSQDATVKIWEKSSEQAQHTISVHQASISDISLHPTNDFVFAFSEDQFWSLIDINVGQALVKKRDDEDSAPITCGKCHPDGLIFGVGTKDSQVKIWDLRDQKRVAIFPGRHGPVKSLSFSENGYYLASGTDIGEVTIWDLRKLDCVKNIVIDEDKHPVSAISFDQTGSFLAAAASNIIQVYQARSWKVVNTFENHTAPPTSIRFGELAQFIVTSSMDKSIRVFS